MTSSDWWRDLDNYVDPETAQEFKCPICIMMCKTPVELACGGGHLFCEDCAADINSGCPMCHKDYPYSNRALAVERFMENQLRIQCPDCSLVMIAGKGGVVAQQHALEHCVKSPCADCGTQFTALGMAAHLSAGCTFTCPTCSVEMSIKARPEHDEYHIRKDALVANEATMARLRAELLLLADKEKDDVQFLRDHSKKHFGAQKVEFTIRVIDVDTDEFVNITVKPFSDMAYIKRRFRIKMDRKGGVSLNFNGEEVDPRTTVAGLGLRQGSELIARCNIPL
jgi:DNA-directed RNA polymerase subunit RPC12/RpoP